MKNEVESLPGDTTVIWVCPYCTRNLPFFPVPHLHSHTAKLRGAVGLMDQHESIRGEGTAEKAGIHV